MTAFHSPFPPLLALRHFTSCFLARAQAESQLEHSEAERLEAERIRQERLQAVEYALAALADFPATLALTLDTAAFTGLPAAPRNPDNAERGSMRSNAVAFLGEGVWLHHARTSRGPLTPARDEVTLVVPDGGRYLTLPIEDDETLARTLIRLGLHNGHGCHEVRLPRQR
ncbi:hypothetical protein AB0M39_37190 [Streptomyces sp. NPDC051907]|uniref:hypothetical protein n=1 Tax=Streptomyces sp. NPDC051907 TaxID=3155284 RepID=UPI0034391A70